MDSAIVNACMWVKMDGVIVRDCMLVFGNMGERLVLASKTMEVVIHKYDLSA